MRTNSQIDVGPDYPRSAMEMGLETGCIVALLYSTYVVVDSWGILPESVPTHFGISGETDAWGPKWTVLLLPLISTILYLLLTLLRRIPHRLNYPFRLTSENAERQVRLALLCLLWVKIELVWSFTYIHWISIEVAIGNTTGLGSYFLLLFLGFIFTTIAWYLIFAFRVR